MSRSGLYVCDIAFSSLGLLDDSVMLNLILLVMLTFVSGIFNLVQTCLTKRSRNWVEYSLCSSLVSSSMVGTTVTSSFTHCITSRSHVAISNDEISDTFIL